MAPKSIFRQPGAKHFQLVHRSQRDPLINDPDAPEHVLKEFERKNAKEKSFARHDDDLEERDSRLPGEAALYGIYFDDRDYDYTQHLRAVGIEEQGVDSILLEAPARKPRKANKKAAFDLIPKEALPSEQEGPRTYDAQEAVPSSIAGFQPDMDPHLRQTLEALDDEAFVDENLEDDFFDELIGDGERDEDEEVEFEFREDGIQLAEQEEKEDVDDWQVRFAKFKLQQKKRVEDGSILEGESEGGDTLGRLPSLSVAGAKKRRRKGTSDASGYSMSSSSMFRNEGLTRLDEQFEKFEQEYASDADDDRAGSAADSEDSAPALKVTREDFEAVLDDFLAQEQLGNKLKPKLEGDTPQGKLDTIRRTLMDRENADERARREALLNKEDEDDAPILMPVDIGDKQDRWDCETILSTYSNLENHPRLLKITQPRGTKKIHLDANSGLPTVQEADRPQDLNREDRSSTDEESFPGGLVAELKAFIPDAPVVKVTVTRSKNETTEEKRARKQAIKKEKQDRRKEKKGNKELFASERKQQSKALSNRAKPGVRKL